MNSEPTVENLETNEQKLESLKKLIERENDLLKAKETYAKTFNHFAVIATRYKLEIDSAKTDYKKKYYKSKIEKMRDSIFDASISLELIEKTLTKIKEAKDKINKDLPSELQLP